MKNLPWKLPVISLVFLSACSTMEVKSEKSGSANLSRYRTYSWTSADAPSQRPVDAPVLDQDIRRSLDESLAQNGFVKVASGEKADFQVNYAVKSAEHTVILEDPEGPWGHPNQVENYEDGALIVEFIDTGTRKTFWRGAAEAEIDAQSEVAPKTQEAANKIVAQYRKDEAKAGGPA